MRRNHQIVKQKVLTLNLTAIELATVAELNRELAQANEEAADDPTVTAETRRVARAQAAALRERAKALHLEAQRRTAEPMYGPPVPTPAVVYIGPERRSQARRTEDRRHSGESARCAPEADDRRTTPDRRQQERRAGALLLR
jgi:hypothetical protein